MEKLDPLTFCKLRACVNGLRADLSDIADERGPSGVASGSIHTSAIVNLIVQEISKFPHPAVSLKCFQRVIRVFQVRVSALTKDLMSLRCDAGKNSRRADAVPSAIVLRARVVILRVTTLLLCPFTASTRAENSISSFHQTGALDRRLVCPNECAICAVDKLRTADVVFLLLGVGCVLVF